MNEDTIFRQHTDFIARGSACPGRTLKWINWTSWCMEQPHRHFCSPVMTPRGARKEWLKSYAIYLVVF